MVDLNNQKALVFITNFNRNFTGVSSTAAAIIRQSLEIGVQPVLVGEALPGCPTPLTKYQAYLAARQQPTDKPFHIFHVRRNNEMMFALFLRDIMRCPIKIVFTSAYLRRHSAFPRWLIGKIDFLISTSEADASYHDRKIGAIVPHGIATALFEPSENRQAAWQALGYGGTFGIASFGRIRPLKGTDVYVDALIKTLPDFPDAVGLVAGKAKRQHQAYLAAMMKRVKDAGLSKQIIFTGELSQKEIRAMVPAISLACATPRYEGFGVTVLEAMSCATPIVASDAGYFPSIIADHDFGRVAPAGDVDATAEAMRHFLDAPELTNSRGVAARRHAIENFDISIEQRGIALCYEKLWANSFRS